MSININWDEIRPLAEDLRRRGLSSYNSLVFALSRANDIDPDQAREEVTEKARAWHAPAPELVAVVLLLAATSHFAIQIQEQGREIEIGPLTNGIRRKLADWGLINKD